MNIKPVNSSALSGATSAGKIDRYREQDAPSEIKRTSDKLELSSKAIELSKQKEATKVADIKKKVDQGFYNSPSVIRQAAERLSQELE